MKMRTAGGVAGLVLIVAGVAAAQDPAPVEAGRKAFAAQKCSICHSIAGQGNKNGSLDGVGSKLSADEIRLWLTNAPEMAATVMRAFTLPKPELDSLVEYLQSLKK
jgi:mono/diheme cytochrome c family protein